MVNASGTRANESGPRGNESGPRGNESGSHTNRSGPHSGHIDWRDPDSVGRLIVRVRRLLGVSQRALATQIGVNCSTIGRMEVGKGMPGLEVLATILDLAGLSLTVVDAQGRAVEGFEPDSVRDRAGRRFPAHHDVYPLEDAPAAARRARASDALDPAGHGPDATWSGATWGGATWSVSGRARDRLREKRSGSAEPGADHPNPTALTRQRWLRIRYPRVWAGPVPTAPDCRCLDDCFELTCLPECDCQCEPWLSA